jgi:hypothetical protein
MEKFNRTINRVSRVLRRACGRVVLSLTTFCFRLN